MDIESNSRIQRSIDFPSYPSSVTLSRTTHSTATAQNPNWKNWPTMEKIALRLRKVLRKKICEYEKKN